MQRIKVDAFGRRLHIERIDSGWVAFDVGNEGKRRKASDIVIPANLEASKLVGFLDDLLHESATERHPQVVMVNI